MGCGLKDSRLCDIYDILAFTVPAVDDQGSRPGVWQDLHELGPALTHQPSVCYDDFTTFSPGLQDFFASLLKVNIPPKAEKI